MRKKKVLYVEDEIFLARIVAETLEGKGYEVITENDGGKALARFQQVSPDICVLDIMLPNLDGFSIADQIREKDTHVPIIFLSAKSQTSDVLKGFNSGANDYMRKPFSIEELIARIENLTKDQPAANNEGEDIGLGKYVFNSRRQTLAFQSEVKKLSYRESELLRLLFMNRDNIVERSQLLNLLWGSDSFFNSRTLDVYIAKLRSYLKQDPSIEIITIKGIGYRFVTG